MLYGEDTNFNGLLDYNERDGDTSLPADNNDDTLEQGWIAYLSCYSKDVDTDADGEDRVNVNQASLQDLELDLGVSRAHAQWIMDNRTFESIADLITDNSPDEPVEARGNQAQPLDVQTYQQIVDYVTIAQGENRRAKVNVNTAPKEVLVALLEAQVGAEKTCIVVPKLCKQLSAGRQW
jgi:hypothetical protein